MKATTPPTQWDIMSSMRGSWNGFKPTPRIVPKKQGDNKLPTRKLKHKKRPFDYEG